MAAPRPQALPAFLARDGRSKTTGRGRRLSSFLPRGCKQGCDSCRTSSVWGAGSSVQPLRGLPSSLSDLSGLLRCEGTSGLFPPSCGERTLPTKPLIYTPASAARRRPGRPPSHLFRGRDPSLRSDRRGLRLPPQLARAAGARFSQPFRTSARARLSLAREAAGESASEAKLTGLVAVGTRGEEVLPRLVPGLLPPRPRHSRPRAATAPGAGPRGRAPEGAPCGAQLTATGVEENRPHASPRGALRSELNVTARRGFPSADGPGGRSGLTGGELSLGDKKGKASDSFLIPFLIRNEYASVFPSFSDFLNQVKINDFP